MEISIADQIALDDALVAPADRLKIGKCNLRLSSDVTSKEATLQVVYDVLKLTPFYKAFQVTADAPEIYMQEFWASAYVHNRSVRFKMNNKKHIIGLDQFRDILQICPKVGNKKFEEPPLEKEILAFLASLGHSGDIRKITDVNVNKLHQPWRSFAAIINKCLSGKPSYDSLRLSQAQILWGMYNKKNVDYAYLLWEDFIFQIENKNTKKGNAMYYPRFTKLVVNFVMDKDPSIPRRNKVNWHYARDDPMFTTINVILGNDDTQLSDNFTIKMKPPRAPKKERKSLKGKQKTTELETISEGRFDSDEGTGVTHGFPMHMIMGLRGLISPEIKDDEDDDETCDDEISQDDDDEEQNCFVEVYQYNLDGRDDVLTDVLLPSSRHQEIEDICDPNLGIIVMVNNRARLFIWLRLQHAESKPRYGVDDIFRTHTEPLSLLILLLLATKSSYFASLFGFDYRLKAEAVALQSNLKYDRIREESNTANQQFLDSIDEGMKKIIKEQVGKDIQEKRTKKEAKQTNPMNWVERDKVKSQAK
ncbi:hypothetical protein Tco_0749745 [Tanacetum coccineum]|uniref:Uncharacterized protein n=1 Tax=Tanacetum coccineum TaxID=301880 RepID=A0ABQ4YZE0_9ASTR